MRFSLRWLFIATTVGTLYAALLFAVPRVVGVCGIIVLSSVIMGLAVSGAMHGNARQRTFFICFAISSFPCPPLTALLIYPAVYNFINDVGIDDADIPVFMHMLPIWHVLGAVAGGAGLFLRRWYETDARRAENGGEK